MRGESPDQKVLLSPERNLTLRALRQRPTSRETYLAAGRHRLVGAGARVARRRLS